VLPEELRVSHLAKEFYPLGMKKTPTRKSDAWGTPRFSTFRCIASVILNFYGRRQEEGAKAIVGHPL
jgi:hypothetical protein